MVDKIIRNLNMKEYDLFLLETGTGTNTRKITTLLRKNEHIERSEIFKRVFKKTKTSANDYLLRNELSILKKKLENFILKNSNTDIPAGTAYFKPYVMAQWCIKKILIDEANKYIKEAVDLALKKDSWKGLLNINKLLLHTVQYSKSNYQYKLDLLNQLANDHIEYLKNYVAEETRYADFIRAGAYKLASNLRKSETKFNDSVQFSTDLKNTKSKAAQYYHLKSLAYSSSGPTAIKYLEKAVECLNDNLEIFLLEEERMACMSAMSMEYAISGDLKKAAVSFEKVINDPGFENFTARNSLIFNYCTTLLKLTEYKKAIYHLDKLDTSNVEPIVKERIYTMKCNCYIFMEDVKGIKRILPKNLQSYDLSVRTYYRFLYVIYYLIKGDIELAEREINNIKNIRGFDETDYSPLVNIFNRYMEGYNAKLYKEKGYSQKILLLKNELQEFKTKHREVSQLLPGVWIINKCESFLKL